MGILDLFRGGGAEPQPARAEPQIGPIRDSTAGISLTEATRGSDLYDMFTGGLSGAGVPVTEQTAMSVSAVYACVSLISGAIASLPLSVYKKSADGSREAVQPNVWWLLNEQLSEGPWSAAVGREFSMSSLLLRGDWYWEIKRKNRYSPEVAGFQPWAWRDVEVLRATNGDLIYRLTDRDTNKARVVHQSDMIHVPGPGFNGKNGMSQLSHGLRHSAGLALAATQYAESLFKNGARPEFALEIPGKLTREQKDELRDAWAERFEGPANSGKPALLTGGMKVHELNINPEDAQLLQTRNYQVEDVCRLFGVPPHMIGKTDQSTSWGTGIEQMSIGFVKYTLQRHLTKIEQELNRKLFKIDRYFCEFQVSGLERGDFKSRNEGYRIAAGRSGEPGWMTINEIRKKENLPPISGGDVPNLGGATNGNGQTTPPAGG